MLLSLLLILLLKIDLQLLGPLLMGVVPALSIQISKFIVKYRLRHLSLEDQLKHHVMRNQLSIAIETAEKALRKKEVLAFKQVIGKNLAHLVYPLKDYIQDFHSNLPLYQSQLENKSSAPILVIYSEMIDFSINTDEWYLDLFACTEYTGLEDTYWAADWEISTPESFLITGFEDLQVAFAELNRVDYREVPLEWEAAHICEFLITLRLQEAFNEAFKIGIKQKAEWTKLPIVISSHDSPLAYLPKKHTVWSRTVNPFLD